MVSGVVGFTANHQHYMLRDQSIRLRGVEVNPAELQAPDVGEIPTKPNEMNAERTSEVQLSAEMADPATRLRALILATLTGRNLLDPPAIVRAANTEASAVSAQIDAAPAQSMPDEVFTLSIHERESSGMSLWVSLTLDGERIDGGFSYRLSRTNQWQQSLSLEGVRAFLDPLVLNFSGPLRLSDQRSAFDLNADGDTEMIARFASNSYALARDLNANGRIDDGVEVIGALSGNGFSELAQWDDNDDGLITAADPVWQDLVLWQPGREEMLTLASKEVRALGLEQVASPFTFTQNSGEPLGRVTATGYFVAGNAVQIAQQIDLAV